MMQRWLSWFAVTVLVAVTAAATDLRPPAAPLLACDPYFSIWSMADRLTDDVTRHWTGTPHPLGGLARIDGKPFRMIGNEPPQVPAMEQRSLRVLPTRTIYEFEAGGVGIQLTFMTPALAGDLELLARPVTYITWTAHSSDGQPHDVSLYFDASALIAVNTPEQEVAASRYQLGSLTVLRAGSQEQPILKKSGDNLRIDWGYLCAVTPPVAGGREVIGSRRGTLNAFAENRPMADADDLSTPRPAGQSGGLVLAYQFDLGRIASTPVSRYLVLAYDDLYSIEYLYRRLRPYWRRNGGTARELLEDSLRDYASLNRRCAQFDEELMADMRRVGGEEYAALGALAYRQALAAQKLAANYDGTPLYFEKETFSGANISTVDVIYPAAPILLLFNPRLVRASLLPVLEFAASGRWPFPYAPHDVGTYPLANGQRYWGGDIHAHLPPPELERITANQMPVEESANMLILFAALARVEGGAQFAAQYWKLVAQWAEYLESKGLDPENQLCTDDFTGHLAHNANLSLKAIEGLASYARLCELTGRKEEAARWRQKAEEYARRWAEMAGEGDHYRLAFDKPGTWSMKYNLVWDRLLGFNMFPQAITRTEMAYYEQRQKRFGVPLDNRSAYTKLDWLLWTATLADSPAQFQRFLAPVYDWLNQTPSRVPLTDWYYTTDGKQAGFQARSVVGGIFIKMLTEEATWKKWAGRGE
jgi:hypothetical protein